MGASLLALAKSIYYYINMLMTAFLMIFRRFPTTFRRFPKIFQIVPKTRRTFPNIFREFPKISEDFRRWSSTFECKNIVFLRVFRYHISRWQKSLLYPLLIIMFLLSVVGTPEYTEVTSDLGILCDFAKIFLPCVLKNCPLLMHVFKLSFFALGALWYTRKKWH